MAESSRRAARARISNVLFVVAAAEAIPPELRGVAARVTVQFPWASLLRGCLGLDDAVAAGIASLLATSGPRVGVCAWRNSSDLPVPDRPPSGRSVACEATNAPVGGANGGKLRREQRFDDGSGLFRPTVTPHATRGLELAPAATLELLLGPSARDGLAGVPTEPVDVIRAAAATFARFGLEVVEGRPASAAELVASSSTWAKRLLSGGGRSAVRPVTVVRLRSSTR
jgi:hypothetical protein